MNTSRILAIAACAVALPFAAAAQEKVTYLTAAPTFLPAFGPIVMAKGKGFYKEEGLDVEFAVGKGGIDVAKQIGAGNAVVGQPPGDGSIIVRPNGVPVKIIATYGGQGFMQVGVRKDANIKSPADLKGKKISTMSLQDGTFYAMLGVLASAGLTRNDVEPMALGPAGVWKAVADGSAVACACVPDWLVSIQNTGTEIEIWPSDKFFPAMSQAIAASDETIAKNPELLRKIVRASMRGMKTIMDNPEAAAKEYVTFVKQWEGKEEEVARIFKGYATYVYPGQQRLGMVDMERLAKVRDFYKAQGIIDKALPIEELATNAFVPEKL